MNDNSLPAYFDSGDIITKYSFDDRLAEYIEAVLEYNVKVNIVSRETSRPDLLKIAADSLLPFEFGLRPAGRLFDIGSGGGFPAVVILLAFPQLEGVLFERTGKKASFLQTIIGRFGLNAKIINKDFGEAAPSLDKASFDFGTIKLVRPDHRIILGVARLLRPGGSLVYYAARNNIKCDISGFSKTALHDYYLDDRKRLRSLTIIS